MKVAVLGCGPAGLLAATACEQFGHRVDIYSERAARSPHAGAQYLHEPIEDVTHSEPDGHVTFLKVGNREGYAQKVYGHPDAPCSWDFFETGERPAWSMGRVYDRLWTRWLSSITESFIGPKGIPVLADEYDHIISTIPAPAICKGGHKFNQQEVYFAEGTKLHAENTLLYNGQRSEGWYRTSLLFGQGWTEYTKHGSPGQYMFPAKWERGFKPISNDCNCWPAEQLSRVGRFGKWERDVLAHHAYEDARKIARVL